MKEALQKGGNTVFLHLTESILSQSQRLPIQFSLTPSISFISVVSQMEIDALYHAWKNLINDR